MVSNIWLDIVHTLQGQWDGIAGNSEAKITQQHEFLIIWTTTLFMTSNYNTPYWHFQPLKLLFPPRSHKSLKSLVKRFILMIGYLLKKKKTMAWHYMSWACPWRAQGTCWRHILNV